MFQTPHRRLNPLTREWILVSPHRAKRPWLGQLEKMPIASVPAYDPTCYLCPGNERAGGIRNPAYTSTFVFDNDFAALLPDTTSEIQTNDSSLLVSESEQGICRVICFSPRHDLSLPELNLSAIENVISTWAEQSDELGRHNFMHYAQVFENKGEVMGASNPHPHSQIWASGHIPNEPYKELTAQRDYHRENEHPLIADYIAEEHRRKERILASNDHFTALVPFWAIWPFEILLSAHRPGLTRLTELTSSEVTALAEILKIVTTRYDNLFEVSFPYSMGFHQAPFDGEPHPEWILHAHFYPPLLRSATVRKFMVGYEMLAMPQRDITPEAAAERLRTLPEIHYKQRNESVPL
ncbi:MAG TPA: UDP-glucose--hexose-1-phosphate uridylyltransferase [Anaerolineales bacterium]|nr:UDP-glucose--hexose-1-phosphate uridylyltransferase [Anaerolineales bacterium]